MMSQVACSSTIKNKFSKKENFLRTLPNTSTTLKTLFALRTKQNTSAKMCVLFPKYVNMKQMTSTLTNLRTSSPNICLAGKLVSQRNWFGGETGLAKKLVWQGNWFLLPLLKQITYNAKVSDITILWFLKKQSRWQQLEIEKTN